MVEVTEIKYRCINVLVGNDLKEKVREEVTNAALVIEGAGLPRQGDWNVRDLTTWN